MKLPKPTPDQEAYLKRITDHQAEGYDPSVMVGGPSKLVRGCWHPFDTAPIEVRAIEAAMTKAERIERGVIDFRGTDADGSVLLVGRDALTGEAKVWGWMPKPTW